jgi:hypothetical protein
MLRQLAYSIAATLLGSVAAHAAEEPAPEELETVVVTGEVPGPGLWKITKGDHVMWVLANYGPLPKGMTWRSRQIDARIAESQEVLYAPNVNIRPNIGLMRGITMIPAAIKAMKIPDGKTLKDVLPPADYARWLALREKYIGKKDDVEKLRPAIALGQLRAAAFRKHGLQGGPNVLAVIGEARKKHKVARVWPPAVERTIEVKNPRGILKGVRKLQLPDLDCLVSNLDRVEPDVERAKVLANAWSQGDTATLRSMFRDVKVRDAMKEGCADALISAMYEQESSADAAHMKKMMEDSLWHAEQASLQAQLDWLKAAQAALAKNKSTFAVLNLAEVLSPDGHLEKLRALGYTVEEPR